MIGTLAELAGLPGMPSEPTLRAMILAEPDFPGIVRRGVGKGDPWEIDLRVAAAHVAAAAERKAEELRRREEDRRQIAMDLGLGSASAEAGVTAADRKALLEEELVALKVGQARGELVSKASVEAALAELMVWLAQQMSSVSARLAKRADVPRPVQIALDELMSRDMRGLASRLREMAEVSIDGDGGSNVAATALDAQAA